MHYRHAYKFYGYINTGLSIAENVDLVDHFIEKPILEQVKKHFQSDEYFWNSGIFVYDIHFFFNLAMNLQPDLFCIAEKAFNTAIKNEKNLTIDDEADNEIKELVMKIEQN
ncbi:sugar phosphate nucleotidyltransferase [Rickettsia australis]|uniref:sugar phosphate nucleotidyltransferase n=1 Tax=Rickettsia australis TaxID=787 RepID=UPI0002F55425|nr:sugar phosphate nucleotidyltransferase [Rickettsia australis]